MDTRPHIRELAAAWPTLLGSTVGYGSASALFMYSANLFVVPLERASGWTRGQIALGISLTLLLTALAMPFVGRIVDSRGPRLVALGSLVGYAACCILLGTVPLTLTAYYALMLLIALFFPGTSPVVFARLISAKFDRLRGTALAVMLSGTAVLLTPLAPVLTHAMRGGYQPGYLILGAVAVVIGLPAAALALKDQKPRPGRAPEGGAALFGSSLGEALRTSSFWQLALAISASAISLGGILSQLSPILLSKHVAPGEAATLASLFVLAALVGRILIGAMLDILNAALVAGIVMALPAVAAVLVDGQNPPFMICAAFVVLAGSAMGAEADFAGYFVSRYFGRISYSGILGTLVMFMSGGLAAGAYLTGALYDRVGGYDEALYLAAAGFALSAAAFVTLWRRAPLRMEAGSEVAVAPASI